MKNRLVLAVIAVLALGLVADLATAQKGKGGGKGGGGKTLPADPNIAYISMQGSGLKLMDTRTGEVGELAGNAQHAAWSPDGSQIAFRQHNGNTSQPAEIRIKNTDGSGSEQFVVAAVPGWGGLDWSRATTPNGRHMLLYGELNPAHTLDICTVELDGTGRTELVFGADRLSQPRWSPSGNQFVCRVAGKLNIYTVGLVNGTLAVVDTRQITDVPAFPRKGGPTCDWSNDGKWIVAKAASSSGYLDDLWIIDPTNLANSRQLTFTPGVIEDYPTFDASDTRVYFRIADNRYRLYSIDALLGGAPVLESGSTKFINHPQCRRD